MQSLLDAKYLPLRARALDHLRKFAGFGRAEIEAWQLGRLNETLGHCARHSPFYRGRHESAQLPDRVSNLADLASVPFTTKHDLRREYPFGLLAAPREELIRYGESTGTSGPPTSAFITYEDWIFGNVWVEEAFHRWFTPGDLVIIAIPYELTFASYDLDRALEALGVTVVPVGALNQVCPFERVVQMVHRLHPTAIVCTPTRALRLHDISRRMGLDPLEAKLKTLLYVGETAAESKLRRIARMLNVSLVNAYGSTETNSLALPCPAGRLHLTEDRHYFEVVDPATGTVLSSGRRGELVLTSLMTKAMPMIRYRTGDLVTIATEPCACGSRRNVIVHSGRVDERFVIGDTVIQRIDIEQLILSFEGTEVYYVADVRDDTLLVRVVLDDTADRDICRQIETQIVDAYGIEAEVAPIAREIITRAMDRMLKPGGLKMDDLGIEVNKELVK